MIKIYKVCLSKFSHILSKIQFFYKYVHRVINTINIIVLCSSEQLQYLLYVICSCYFLFISFIVVSNQHVGNI